MLVVVGRKSRDAEVSYVTADGDAVIVALTALIRRVWFGGGLSGM